MIENLSFNASSGKVNKHVRVFILFYICFYSQFFTDTLRMICKKHFIANDVTVNVGSKGYKSLLSTSKDRQDYLFTDELSLSLPY